MNIDDLIKRLKSATYRDKGDKYDYHILSSTNAELAVVRIVSEWAAEQISDVELNKKCAEFEAKCYAYEKIIANSNFAPMLEKKNSDSEPVAVLEEAEWYLKDEPHGNPDVFGDTTYDVCCSRCGNIAFVENKGTYEEALHELRYKILRGEIALPCYCSKCGRKMREVLTNGY